MTDRLAWFRQARFGMFLHWGVYSVLRNGEWVMNADSISPEDYARVAEAFTAEQFDADAWAQAAVDAGMKYVVLTTKHHDGFCLWDTSTTDFNSVQIGPRRDIVAEYVAACRRHGLRVGLYWSLLDWHQPDWARELIWTEIDRWRRPLPDPAAHARMIDYLHAQVRELLTNYGPIDVLWFDGCVLSPDEYRSAELVAMIRALQPDCLINDRTGLPGDFGTPEGIMPAKAGDRPWELCHCMHSAWGIEADDPNLYYPHEELFGLLCDAMALGGNLLLNVGPQADGRFPAVAQAQLDALGRWMAVNGEAIYGTEAGPFGRQSWGVSTRKGQTVYLHVTRPTHPLLVRGLATRVSTARLLATGEALSFQQDDVLALQLPPLPEQEGPIVIALECDAEPQVTPQGILPEGDGSLLLTANAAVVQNAADTPAIAYYPDALGGRLTNWTQLDDAATWTFTVTRPGPYTVTIDFQNSDRLNSYARRFEVTVAGQTLRASAPQTGRLYQFHRYRLAGRVDLPEGQHALTVKPYMLGTGILMNLRTVILQPDTE